MMDTTAKILLVDDEPAFQRLCGDWLAGQGYEVKVAASAEQVREHLAKQQSFDLVLLDLALPPGFRPEEGLKLLPLFEDTPVVVLTGHADQTLALQAVEQGAWDFLGKPADPDMLRVVVQRALYKHALEQEVKRLRVRCGPEGEDNFGLLGNSPSLRELRDLIRRVGPAEIPVIISGPSGTGKELVARALHRASLHAHRPFVPVHCGAIPPQLFESEFFGHLKGSFTGADRNRAGLIESAAGGTLFLDEVAEMPLPMQVKLLRFLQQGTFYPVGGREERKVETRIIAATNRDLAAMVQTQAFREDLYYRLRGILLQTVALKQRIEDIPVLARAFLNQGAKKLSSEALRWLMAQTWTGNVRELQQTLACALVLAGEDAAIDVKDLALASGVKSAPDGNGESLSLQEQLAALEKSLCVLALEETRHNHTHAAKRLGISRAGLLKKMRKYGLR